MDFRDSYYSFEARLNNKARDEKIRKIIVRPSKDEKRTEKILGGDTYIITVLPEEYERAMKMSERINYEKYTEDLNKQETKQSYDTTQERWKNGYYYDKLCAPFEPREKRNLKNQPNKAKNKKFVVKHILVKIISTLAATSVIIGGTHLAKQEVSKYKERVATESLETLKDELNAERIWDNSSATSSNSDIIDIEVTGIDGKKYIFNAHRSDGNIDYININTIKNSNVVDAVSIVADAQNGNLFETIKADKLTNRIKSGEVDLKYPGNTEKTLEEIEK